MRLCHGSYMELGTDCKDRQEKGIVIPMETKSAILFHLYFGILHFIVNTALQSTCVFHWVSILIDSSLYMVAGKPFEIIIILFKEI